MLSPSFHHFSDSVLQIPDPTTYHQAAKLACWRLAMKDELNALIGNKTWIIVPLPPGKSIVGSAMFNWTLPQLDVNNAFLNGELHEEVYMDIPPGYHLQGDSKLKSTAANNLVYKLQKSLYGLKQASRQWNLKFTECLLKHGYKHSRSDYSLFTKKVDEKFVALLIYVDNIIIASNINNLDEELKGVLKASFKLKDLANLKYFLGLGIARSKKEISVCQRKYTLELLQEYGQLGCKPSRIPFEVNHKLVNTEEDRLNDPSFYRQLVGKLLYLTLTRPDISYGVHVLSQFMERPAKVHLEVAYKVLRYLKQTPGQGILMSSTSELHLKAYTVSDWASCQETRKSIFGYCIFTGNSMVSWKTKKQNTMSRISIESEYMAMAVTTSEVLWLTYLLKDVEMTLTKPVELHCGNISALHIAKNPLFHERTKHIEKRSF
ncbi:uncharacterized mitochondrial protein AtMg00810-like [Ricinus communis]|uniref:uncharacterized mitochondrial protein AtMg00810-like n=1 Tax=Ricinus communis TaxID=3988 RepID=UPI00201B25A5|nr:uncharacterized mitochondrial protein AtMg00810-like [Ricinus communis]